MLSEYADWVNMMALMKSEFLGKCGAMPAILRAAGIDDDADTLLVLWDLHGELDAIQEEKRKAEERLSKDPRTLFAR